MADKAEVTLSVAEQKEMSNALIKELGYGDELPEAEPDWLKGIEMEQETPEEQTPETPETGDEAGEAETGKKWTYTREDGTVKEFDSREDYLEYKIGADANKWAEKYRRLEEKLEALGEKPEAAKADVPPDPKELLFDEAVRKNEDWAPFLDVMTGAFSRFYGLLAQEQQAKTQELMQKYEALESKFGETAVRTEYGISKTEEQEVLEMQPRAVRESLMKLSAPERLAVIKQLADKGKSEKEKPAIPKAVTPQQAHVERSAMGEPDRDPHDALAEKFDKMDFRSQLALLGQGWKQIQSD